MDNQSLAHSRYNCTYHIRSDAFIVSEAIQATTKVLWISMPQQILYTIFKVIGIPFGTVRFREL